MKYWRHAPTAPSSPTASTVRDRSGSPQFLADRGTRKPSAHTLKAYRQDFDAIATLIAGGAGPVADAAGRPSRPTRCARRSREYAETHEAASIQRCWSTWNVLCTFLYTAELIAANPMPMVGRPKLAKTLPKALPADVGGRPAGRPRRRPAAAATHRLDRARPRPDPHRAAGRAARR